MSVRRRKYRDPETGSETMRWVVDVDFQRPDGNRERVRKTSPVQTLRGAEQYERQVRAQLLTGRTLVSPALADSTSGEKEKEVPTFGEFAETFMATYSKANNKISEQTSKQSILDHRLLPRFGNRRLDSFTVLDLDAMKADMLEHEYAPKTINNTLATFSKNPALRARSGRSSPRCRRSSS